MDWETLVAWADGNANLEFLLVFLFLVFGAPAILSEKAAEKLGLFGVAARKWQAYRKRSRDAQWAIAKRERDDLWAEIKRVDKARKADLESLKMEVRELRAAERSQHEYILWITSLMRGLEVWAADLGLELPPPPFKTYTEWQQEIIGKEGV